LNGKFVDCLLSFCGKHGPMDPWIPMALSAKRPKRNYDNGWPIKSPPLLTTIFYPSVLFETHKQPTTYNTLEQHMNRKVVNVPTQSISGIGQAAKNKVITSWTCCKCRRINNVNALNCAPIKGYAATKQAIVCNHRRCNGCLAAALSWFWFFLALVKEMYPVSMMVALVANKNCNFFVTETTLPIDTQQWSATETTISPRKFN